MRRLDQESLTAFRSPMELCPAAEPTRSPIQSSWSGPCWLRERCLDETEQEPGKAHRLGGIGSISGLFLMGAGTDIDLGCNDWNAVGSDSMLLARRAPSRGPEGQHKAENLRSSVALNTVCGRKTMAAGILLEIVEEGLGVLCQIVKLEEGLDCAVVSPCH